MQSCNTSYKDYSSTLNARFTLLKIVVFFHSIDVVSICYLVCMWKTLTEPLPAHGVSQVKKDVFHVSWKLCEFFSCDFPLTSYVVSSVTNIFWLWRHIQTDQGQVPGWHRWRKQTTNQSFWRYCLIRRRSWNTNYSSIPVSRSLHLLFFSLLFGQCSMILFFQTVWSSTSINTGNWFLVHGNLFTSLNYQSVKILYSKILIYQKFRF